MTREERYWGLKVWVWRQSLRSDHAWRMALAEVGGEEGEGDGLFLRHSSKNRRFWVWAAIL